MKTSLAQPIQMSDLRRRPGAMVRHVAEHEQRLLIYAHRREMAALVPLGDLQALEQASDHSTERQVQKMLERLGRHDALRQVMQVLERLG